MGSIRVFHVAFFDASGKRLLVLAMLVHSEEIAKFRAVRISREIAAADFCMTLEPKSIRNDATGVSIPSINPR